MTDFKHRFGEAVRLGAWREWPVRRENERQVSRGGSYDYFEKVCCDWEVVFGELYRIGAGCLVFKICAIRARFCADGND